MAMGTRKQREKQEGLWIAQQELAAAPGHPFYEKLNELLEAERFDELLENRCAKFYAAKYGRPSLTRAHRHARILRIIPVHPIIFFVPRIQTCTTGC